MIAASDVNLASIARSNVVAANLPDWSMRTAQASFLVTLSSIQLPRSGITQHECNFLSPVCVSTEKSTPGDRCIWHTVTRVLREREYHLIQGSIRSLDDALGDMETSTETDILTPDRLAYVQPRVQHLLEISETFSKFLNFLLNNAEANMGDLRTRMSSGPDDAT